MCLKCVLCFEDESKQKRLFYVLLKAMNIKFVSKKKFRKNRSNSTNITIFIDLFAFDNKSLNKLIS